MLKAVSMWRIVASGAAGAQLVEQASSLAHETSGTSQGSVVKRLAESLILTDCGIREYVENLSRTIRTYICIPRAYIYSLSTDGMANSIMLDEGDVITL